MYLHAVQPFKLDLSWLRAQAFRWTEPKKDGWFYGVVRDSPIKVQQRGGGIEFRTDASERSLKPYVTDYFRLDQDIHRVHAALRRTDDDGTMTQLIEAYGGMRILRQDPWECLVGYICSQNNEVEGIAKIVADLASAYGARLTVDGVPLYAFPTPQRLSAVGPDALRKLAPGLGRGRRIHEVATAIAEGHLDLNALARMPHQQSRAMLMTYDGIGAKIADCVSLFALDKPQAFPVDRHIEEGLKPYRQKHTAGAANARLMRWVEETFGENAGYASQLLFLKHHPES